MEKTAQGNRAEGEQAASLTLNQPSPRKGGCMKTAKDFEQTARIIRAEVARAKAQYGAPSSDETRIRAQGALFALCRMVALLGDAYGMENPRFDYARFKDACGMDAETEALI